MTTAVLLIDIQSDFTEFRNGSLPVPGTDKSYCDEAGDAARRLKEEGFLIIATKDDHPPTHVSFYTNHPGRLVFDTITVNGHDQVLWPTHCVQGTAGSELVLNPTLFDAIVESATHQNYESYSAFEDDSGHPTELHPYLQENSITRLIIFGIATDYSVRATALSAVRLGYTVLLVKSLCRGITPETTRTALLEMKQKGVKIMDDLDIKKLRG